MTFTGSGLLNFDSFCRVASHFLESEDDEALQKELKEAFRLYDKEGEMNLQVLSIFPFYLHDGLTFCHHHVQLTRPIT